MRTIELDAKLGGLALGAALGGGLVWGLLSLGTGMPLGFLVLPLGAGLGYFLPTRTIERSARLVGVACLLTLASFVVAKTVAGLFASPALLADQLESDEASLRQTVYARELGLMVDRGTAPVLLKEWLVDPTQAPSDKLKVSVEQYLELAAKSFRQKTPEEQREQLLHEARGIRAREGFSGGLALFMSWLDLLWLGCALGLAGYLASGAFDKEIVHHQIQEVPVDSGPTTNFDDLDIESF